MTSILGEKIQTKNYDEVKEYTEPESSREILFLKIQENVFTALLYVSCERNDSNEKKRDNNINSHHSFSVPRRS